MLGKKGVCFVCNTAEEDNLPQLGKELRTTMALPLLMTLIETLVRQGFARIDYEDFSDTTGQGKRLLLCATSQFDNWFSLYVVSTKDVMNL